jgi:hypothetical protein
MEKRRFATVLVCLVTFLGALAVARADAPTAELAATAPSKTQGRKKKPTVKAPKVTLSCSNDDDCALTKMGDGECCPMLCRARAVSKASAEALEKYATVCAKPKSGMCPVPECAPSPMSAVAACVSGKCEAHAAPSPGRE